MTIIHLIYGLSYFIILYTLYISASLYYLIIDLNLKSKITINSAIKDLDNIIYYSNLSQFSQIFLGKYYLNIVFYCLNKLIINHIIIHLSKTTDILFVKIIEIIFAEFKKIPFIPIYFPIKYSIKYLAIAFKCISIKIKSTSKLLEIILNIISLIVCIIPFYLIYVCFEPDSKKILYIEMPILIYLMFNMWICGRTIKDIEEQYGTF